ncbi:hypothetical protein N7492_002912 [Penicillium capsulatum]|uniref:Uncharacterized protein n=1 Tax=Penicillium capsulatum TaxID=69766 RepID=A0A9W9IKW3_9EURO|nr:hypothetical protein N7492_002912 [Penicillium capsulatum]KAJ6122494.1 hypothetical protein N7512_004959 [Penicillium capsulatum]
MARFSLSFLAVFLVLAALAMSLPTKRDSLSPSQQLDLDNAIADLKSATKMMDSDDNKDSDDKKNQSTGDKKDDGDDSDEEEEEKKVAKPTPTSKKATSGNFATPTATHTHHATSKPNALGKLPLVGGLLGGTGGGL